MDAIAQNHQAQGSLAALMGHVAQLLRGRGAHPARTVVLVPYAQLMGQARKAWACAVPDGFAPRFETTMNWTRSRGGFLPGPQDLCFDTARDLLTAQGLLEQAGLAAQRELLAGRLVEAACQLAGRVAAVPPAQRPAWAHRARGAVVAGLEAPALALEAAVARIALEWALASSYATDALLTDDLDAELDCLVVLEGFQAEPLVDQIRARLAHKAVALPLMGTPPAGQVAWHEAQGPEDEAERAAACVLRHLEAGRAPVALAATDRALTRRIRAMLGAQGVRLRDETGWKLSTTRAAAHLMTALQACAWQASSDTVLDWLKHAPAFDAGAVRALEKALRDAGLRDWASASARLGPLPRHATLVPALDLLREGLQRPRALVHWLQGLRELLQAGGQWPLLQGDAAGDAVLAALGLAEDGQALWASLPQGGCRMGLADFSAWVRDALEAASFKPRHPRDEQVVVLPLEQMLAQPFAAAVLPGCDEANLPASPEPPGPWTTAQREALGFDSRATLEAAQRAAWQQALGMAHCDVLWRRGDAAGEPLLPSALVQQMQLAGLGQAGADPRALRPVAPCPTPRPQPRAPQLPVPVLSASAYEDLRRCPYRFFALRQLGLRESDELDADIDKRDFGNWLHAVLRDFHRALAAGPLPPGPARQALLDAVAEAQTREAGLPEDEFLPFSAGWPGLRDGYLAWLESHEAQGLQFSQAESEARVQLGPVQLMGRIDRVDSDAAGLRMVVDYKTENLQVSRDRVKAPTEDTQLAFYAALLEDDTLRAAYVNVGERETRTVEQPEVVAARDALVEGMLHDLAAIGDGAALPALGEGRVCDFCAARGLCRKDFWA
ncbi:MAG: PD-(D/E)XK nuclease family protein [Ramlibacter sp.]|nr:PD-(D/E)XK nuclease family protein [Ramlibacter sp.]